MSSVQETFEDPNANRGPQINAVAIAFICISFLTLVFRFTSRIWTRTALGVDDGLIVAAAIFSWTYTSLCIVEVEDNYYGQHYTKSNPERLTVFLQELYGLAIIYPVALTLSKLALLALYWRIFRLSAANVPMQIVGALNIAWMIAAFIVGIFLCVPVQGFWDPTISSRCVNFNALFLSNEAITIALDLVVLFLPVWYIARIQSSVKHKVSISITFLLGLIATLVSALRLWRLVEAHHMNPEDVTYVETDAALWAIVELNIWVLVASIPTLRPLVRKLKDEQFGPAVARLSPRSTISSYWSLDSLKRKLWSSRSRDDAVDSEVALAGITGGGQASLASDSNSGPRTNPSSKHWDEEALRRSMGKIGMRRDVEVSAE